jgi:hypothetical protein
VLKQHGAYHLLSSLVYGKDQNNYDISREGRKFIMIGEAPLVLATALKVQEVFGGTVEDFGTAP